MKRWISGLLLFGMVSFSEAATKLTFDGEVSGAGLGFALGTPFSFTITLADYAVTGVPTVTPPDETSVEWIYAFNLPTPPLYGQLTTTGADAPLSNFAGDQVRTSLAITSIDLNEATNLFLLIEDISALGFKIGNQTIVGLDLNFVAPVVSGTIWTMNSPDDFFHAHVGTMGLTQVSVANVYGEGDNNQVTITLNSMTVEVEAIPEPSTYLLLGTAAVLLVPLLRRMRRAV